MVSSGSSTVAREREKTTVQPPAKEVKEVFLAIVFISGEFVISVECYSTFTRVQHIVAWILRIVSNCRPVKRLVPAIAKSFLSVSELVVAERYLSKSPQETHFVEDISSLQVGKDLLHGSNLLSLRPFIDSNGVLRVGGKESNSTLAYYSQQHPMILHGNHHLTMLLVRLQHIRLLHA